ncbi:MAG: hypothetical protein AAGE52_15545 [Myxococcota bacterium]
MRTAVLTLALLGSAATGLTGLFYVGTAVAETQRVEQAQRLRPHQVTPQVLAGATQKRNTAIALLISAVLGIAGAVLSKRSRWAAAPLLVGAILPLLVSLWTLCPASPLILAGALATRLPEPTT